ncbi:hypothetical protein QBC37DRAFT_419460 [Rhypophila decipiens]|uniref:DUF6594 domain-containing protein n=1 Tax=Rhypophila decipiens TaxID=261697 RepID=A0AAN6YCH4_9PEZI|nr:hypothetical protein QBC37DRAFT_419460 [Rhypophila decipiens]
MAESTKPRSSKDSDTDAPLTQEDFIQKPWKYIGYKDFTRHAASSNDDFLVLRRFDRVHCRLLLMLQDQVVELESELDALDARLSKRSAPDLDNGSMRNDVAERKDLLERLHRRVREYDDLLSQYTTLKSHPEASKRSIKTIRTWLSNHFNPIHPLEADFINNNDDTDLITLLANSPTSRSPFKRSIEKCILLPAARSLPASLAPPDNHVDAAVEILASLLIVLAAGGMFLAPLWTLAMVVEDPFDRLVSITGFLVVFLTVCTFGTTARPFEVLAATAGYAVVLVVFLQVGIIADRGWGRFFDL